MLAALEAIKVALDRGDIDSVARQANVFLKSPADDGSKIQFAQTAIDIFERHDRNDLAEETIILLLAQVPRSAFHQHSDLVELLLVLSAIQVAKGRAAAAKVNLESAIQAVAGLESSNSPVALDLKLRLAECYRLLGDDLAARDIEYEVRQVENYAVPYRRERSTGVEGVDFTLETIFFGTNRNVLSGRNPYRKFGGQRAPLSLGSCLVSIPTRRDAGTMEMPRSRETERLNPNVDLSRVFFIRSIEVLTASTFAEALRASVIPGSRKEMLIYIHGYNTSFAYAASTGAQLAVDLQINGPTVVYSWPSKASLYSYIEDRGNIIEPIRSDIRSFLGLVLGATKVERIYIVAHSMGCNYLVEAIFGGAIPKRATEIVLASADVDADHFCALFPSIRANGHRFTLYASGDDLALLASQKLHGGYERVGRDPRTVAGLDLDAIDTSGINRYRNLRSSGRHADFLLGALDDLRSVVWLGLPCNRRKTIPRSAEKPENQWVLQVEEGPGANLGYLPGAGPFGQALQLIRYAQLAGYDGRDQIEGYLTDRGMLPSNDAGTRAELDRLLQ